MSTLNGTWADPSNDYSFFRGGARARPAKKEEPPKRDEKAWEPKPQDKKILPAVARLRSVLWGKPEPFKDEPRRLLSDLLKLRASDDYDDYTLRPTLDAYLSAMKLAITAHQQMGKGLPLPRVAPDGNGGIIMEWRNDRGVVKLGCAATGDDAHNYIFYMSGELYRTMKATAENLVERLEWLNHE